VPTPTSSVRMNCTTVGIGSAPYRARR